MYDHYHQKGAPVDREQFFLDMLVRLGVIFRDSHFVYTNGDHGTTYIAKDLLGTLPEVDVIAEEFALRLQRFQPEVIVGPELWGSLLGLATYLHYVRSQAQTRFCPIEKDRQSESSGQTFVLRRGYDKLVAGKRVALIEDILNTGGSAREAARAVTAAGGTVVAVLALCNRGRIVADQLKVPALEALVNLDMEILTEQECSEKGPCSKGVPVREDYGHGAKFLRKQK